MWFVECLFGLSLAALAGGADGSATQEDAKPRPARLTARMLRDDIRSACRRVNSLKISYKAEGYDPKKVLAGAYVHRTLIAKAPCSLFLDSAHGYPGLPWEDDLFRQTAYITPTHERNVYPTNRGYFVRESAPDAGLPGSLPSEVFFMATGIWPLTGRKAPRPNGYCAESWCGRPSSRSARAAVRTPRSPDCCADRTWCAAAPRFPDPG